MEYKINKNDIQDIESIIIGNLISNNDSRAQILTRIEPIHFSNQIARYIFQLASKMNNDNLKIDFVTIIEKIKIDNEYEDIHELIKYITEAVSKYAYYDNIDQYINILINNSTNEQLLKYYKDVIENEFDPLSADEIFNEYANQTNKIISSRNLDNISLIKKYIPDFKNKLDTMKNNKGKILGTPSGISSIDELTNGFQDGDLIILAARPSLGKTALAINFLTNVLKTIQPNSNECVVMFSLEMGWQQILERMLCSECRINNQKIRSGDLDNDQEILVYSKVNEIENYNFFIDDNPSIKVIDIQAKLQQIIKKYKIKLVVIDYLQLIETKNKIGNRSVEVGNISRQLKILARELNIPIIAIAQLSRKIEDRKEADSKPRLSDLRESGSIEQDADIVCFIDYQRDQIDKTEKNNSNYKYKSCVNVDFYIEKNRNGRTGVVKLIFDKSTGKYTANLN